VFERFKKREDHAGSLKQILIEKLQKNSFEYEVHICGSEKKLFGGFEYRYYPLEPLRSNGVKLLCKLLPESEVTNMRFRDRDLEFKEYSKIIHVLHKTSVDSLWIFYPKYKMENIPFEYLILQTHLQKLSFSLTLGPTIKDFINKIGDFKGANNKIIKVVYDYPYQSSPDTAFKFIKTNLNIICVIKVSKVLDGLMGKELNGRDGPLDESRLLIEFYRTEHYSKSYDIAEKLTNGANLVIKNSVLAPRIEAVKYFLDRAFGNHALAEMLDKNAPVPSEVEKDIKVGGDLLELDYFL
jgi:hypothetical protein